MTVRIGLLGSGFVANFSMFGLQNVATWEIPVVASPNVDHARRFAQKWNIPASSAWRRTRCPARPLRMATS